MAGVTDSANRRHLLWICAPRSAVDQAQVVASAAPFHIEVQFAEAEQAERLLRKDRWLAVGVELPPGSPADAVERIRSLHLEFPTLSVLAASSDGSIEMMRAALGAGAADFLALPVDPKELHKAFLRISQARSAGGVCDVFTIFGARGGLGATTLAVNLAVRVVTTLEEPTALIDMDLQRGDVSAFLNLTPHQSIASFTQTFGEVDSMFLENVLARHPSGVAVLPAPPDIEDADQLNREHVEQAFHLMRSVHRYIFVDMPHTLTDPTVVALEQANQVVLLTDLSIPGLRAGQRSMGLFQKLGIEPERVVVLLTELAKSGISMEEATTAIGKAPLMTLPRDLQAACTAMNNGTPLNGRDGGLHSAIASLAEELTGSKGKAGSKPLLRRLFGFGRGANR